MIVPDVGGGFGAKSRTYPEELALGWYARAVGRPVRWTETRTENILAMPNGRAQLQYARLGGTRDGRITAYQLDVVQDAGAFPLIGASLPALTQRMATGVYDIDNVGFTGVSVVTNAVSTTAYRGAGRPEAAVAIERMVDRFAAEIGMDPAEVRRRNYVPRFTEPYTTGHRDGVRRRRLPRVAAPRPRRRRLRRAARRAGRPPSADDPLALGIGLATYVEVTAVVQTPELASVELDDDGDLIVRSGATPFGQGHDTTWAMIVADATGVPLERIRVVHGDTDLVASGGLTVGSRSVQLGGAAIAGATSRLVDAARQRVAELLEAHVADVVLDSGTGRFHVAGTPARSVGWADLVDGDPLAAEYDVRAADADVPVRHPRRRRRGRHRDRDWSGCVRHVAVDDAGTLLNPLLAEGQVHGGIAQGVAQALLEAVHYDDDGQPKTTNFADYPVISAAELPSFELAPMETPTFANELGAKGVGESGTIGAIPAVYNAVIDALAHLGVRHLETPLTPERIWRASYPLSRSGRPPIHWSIPDANVITGANNGDRLRSRARCKGGTHVDVGAHPGIQRSQHQPPRPQRPRHRGVAPLLHRGLGFEQCGDLTHTMTMRFYRGDRSHHHDLALVQVDDPEQVATTRPMVDGAASGSASTTSPSPTRIASRGSTRLRHMKAHGVEFVRRGNHGMTHSAYLYDPDGYGIEVVYDVPSDVVGGRRRRRPQLLRVPRPRRPRRQHRLPALRRGHPRASGDPGTDQHPPADVTLNDVSDPSPAELLAVAAAAAAGCRCGPRRTARPADGGRPTRTTGRRWSPPSTSPPRQRSSG